jgi:hypothetical protein
VLDKWSPTPALRPLPYAAQVDGVIAALFAGEASPDTRGILMNGLNPLADAATKVAVLNTNPKPVPFAQLVGLALGAPEFQRR